MKSNWKIILAVAMGICLLVGAPIVAHYRAKIALESYRRQLIQKGEKLTIAEITPRSTVDARNAGRDVLAAVRRLGSAPAYSLPSMRILSPGHALLNSVEEVLPTEESSNIWPKMTQDIQVHEQNLILLRDALNAPDFDFNLDFSQGFALLLPHLAPLKSSTIWYSMAAIDELHKGQMTNALANLKTGVDMTRPLAREPLMISQLVRVAMGSIMINAAWDALQHSDWQDEQLKELQTKWSSIDLMDGAEASLEMERALLPDTFAAARSSYDTFNQYTSTANASSSIDSIGDILANPKGGYEALMGRFPRYWMWKLQWSYDEERYNMSIQQLALDMLRAVRTNGAFVPESKKFETAMVKFRKSHSAIESRLALGADSGLIQGYLVKLANVDNQRRLLVAAIALKRFQLREGKYPTQLRELTPNYMASVPSDLMDGKPLRYQLRPDGTFLLYSVGEDGEDNGGDATPTQAAEVRNKSWWKARDAVWPSPATPEEVKVYMDEAIAKWKSTMPPPLPFPARNFKGSPPVPVPPNTNTP